LLKLQQRKHQKPCKTNSIAQAAAAQTPKIFIAKKIPNFR
jgi:hypothetical protein